MKDIYEVVCSFPDNIFFEQLKGSKIEKTSYSEFDASVRSIAPKLKAYLVNREIAADSLVGIDMDNSPEWVVSFWAILAAGYKPLLINNRLDESINLQIIRDSGAQAVICDNPKRDIDITFSFIAALSETLAQDVWGDEFALTTSGTSGDPKIYLYDGRALSEQIFNSKYVVRRNFSITKGYKGSIKVLAFLPFYHIFGLVASLMWFSFFGRTFVFLSDLRPQTIQYACKRHGVTHFFAIPIVWNGVAAHVRRQAKKEGGSKSADLERGLGVSLKLQSIFPKFGRWLASNILLKKLRKRVFGQSLRFCISGGGYIKEEALRMFNGLGYSLYNGYGMTEIGIGSVELRKRANDRILGSVGKPFPSIEYRINDGGVLEVRGGSLYCKQIKGGKLVERSKKDWFNTNDVFVKDNEGNYYINGRKDDIIILPNGENIVPDLIEKKFELQYAKTYTVVGLNSGGVVEIVLLIYPEPKAARSQVDEMLLKVYEVNSTLPPHEKLSRVLITIEPLPVVMDTKVQRSRIRQMLDDKTLKYYAVDLGHYSDAKVVIDGNFEATLSGVIDVFCDVLKAGRDEVSGSSNFLLDLDGSSLEYFALLEELAKKFNITFDLEKGYLITPIEFASYIISN